MKGKKVKASMTIELSFLIPLILVLFMGLILSVFYFHDKIIINGAAYETAVWGSQKLREEEGITESGLVEFCRERLKGKCIFLTTHTVDTAIGDDEVQVKILARKKTFSMSVIKKAAVTQPEKKIRDVRRFDIKNGEKSND